MASHGTGTQGNVEDKHRPLVKFYAKVDVRRRCVPLPDYFGRLF